jgi:hypothetical protein
MTETFDGRSTAAVLIELTGCILGTIDTGEAKAIFWR